VISISLLSFCTHVTKLSSHINLIESSRVWARGLVVNNDVISRFELRNVSDFFLDTLKSVSKLSL
jgi:hypothetical protein